MHLSSILQVDGNLCEKRLDVIYFANFCLIFVKLVLLLSQSHATAHLLRSYLGNHAAAEAIHKVSSFTQLRDVEHPTVNVSVSLYVNARTYVGLNCYFKFVFGNTEHPVNSGNLLLRGVPALRRMTLVPSSNCKGKGFPQQAEVAQGFPDRLRPRIFLTFGTTRVVGR